MQRLQRCSTQDRAPLVTKAIENQGRLKSGPLEIERYLIGAFLAEGGQLDEVVVGDLFHRVSGLAPGAEATGNDEHFKS